MSESTTVEACFKMIIPQSITSQSIPKLRAPEPRFINRRSLGVEFYHQPDSYIGPAMSSYPYKRSQSPATSLPTSVFSILWTSHRPVTPILRRLLHQRTSEAFSADTRTRFIPKFRDHGGTIYTFQSLRRGTASFICCIISFELLA